jgi:hypothetical protein
MASATELSASVRLTNEARAKLDKVRAKTGWTVSKALDAAVEALVRVPPSKVLNLIQK